MKDTNILILKLAFCNFNQECKVLSLFFFYYKSLIVFLVNLMLFEFDFTSCFMQDFSNEAVVQEFTLPEGEHLISVERKRYPFYYHEHHESELSKRVRSGSITGPAKNLELPVFDIPVTTHTVLDGCIIVTDCSVYEIRPR